MKRTLLCLSITLLACIGWASPASAAHVNCGDVITQNTTLDSDLVNCPGDGVVIGADNITLDLAGHTIDGIGGGADGQGVDNDEGHDGVTIRRGRIQDFTAAVYFDHGDGGLVRGLTVVNTPASFQAFDSDFNKIERNVFFGANIGLYSDSDGNTIDQNRIFGAGTHVFVFGFDQDRLADGNKITGNRLTGSGDSYGVYAVNVTNTLIEENQIRDHAIGVTLAGLGLGNRIQKNTVSASGDGIVVGGFVDNTVVLRNDVAENDVDGIRVTNLTHGTVVERNTANRNGDDGIDSDTASATITKNTANRNRDLGIEAVPGVTDGGGNKAKGNGNPAQCVGVACS